jgi:large subunit ribosomal protein L35
VPKMKTHRGAAKRFRVTGTGKVMRRKATGNHMLTKKTSARKRRISGMAVVGPEKKAVKRLLGA